MRWGGTPLRELRGRRIARLRAFIPQRAPVPAGVTVREAVELGRSPHIKPLQRPTRHDREAVDRALARTGVFEFAERKLTTLSGGELQRVQIAVGARAGGAGADRRRADLAPGPRRDRRASPGCCAGSPTTACR